MKIEIRNIILLTFLLIASKAFTQEKFSATVSKNSVIEDERFQVTFNIKDGADSFEPPAFSHFNLLSGPNKSSQMSWVNGKSSSSVSYSYVLSASKEGTYTIGEAKIKDGNNVYTSKPIQVKVVKGSQQNNSGKNTSQQNTDQDLSEYVFLKCYTSKRKALVGEQIVATYKLYYNVSLGNVNIKEVPSFNGFWSEQIEVDPSGNQTTEVINGVRYQVATIHKVVLFPQRTGELELEPMVIDLVMQVKDNARSRSLFDQFFGRYKNVQVSVKSVAQKIDISPLPLVGKPKDFPGAVGKYSFSANIDKTEVESNEAINLKVIISGTGNLKLIDQPKITFPADFEVYDPKVSDRTSVSGNGVSGKKEFEYLIIPRHGGDFEIPPIAFSYYDLEQKKYVDLSSKGFEIHVKKGADEGASVSKFSGNSKSDISVIGSDIRFIDTSNTQVFEKGKFFIGSGLFYALLYLPIILFGGFIIAKSRMDDFNSNTVLVKNKKANKVAKKRLSIAEANLKTGELKNFYEEIFKALYGYLSDKLNIDDAHLNKESIQDALLSKGVPQATIDSLKETLDNCEMARFAPMNNVSENTVYQNAVDIISKIEEEVK